jgi:hypothetical protein
MQCVLYVFFLLLLVNVSMYTEIQVFYKDRKGILDK